MLYERLSSAQFDTTMPHYYNYHCIKVLQLALKVTIPLKY